MMPGAIHTFGIVFAMHNFGFHRKSPTSQIQYFGLGAMFKELDPQVHS